MALQNLDQRALDLIGAPVTDYIGISQAMLDDFFSEGVRDVVKKVAAVNFNKLELFCAAPTALSDASGKTLETALTSDIIFQVTRSDGVRSYTCRKVPPRVEGELGDVNSIFYASKRDPAFFIKSRVLYVKPDPTTVETASIYHPAFAFVDASSVDHIDDITGMSFPYAMDEAVILYVVIQVKMRESGYARKEAYDELVAADTSLSNFSSSLPTIVMPAPPTLPTLTLQSLGSMATSLPTFSPNVLTIDSTQIDSAITKASSLIDTDFDAYLVAKDLELASISVSGAGEEVQRAAAAIQKESTKIQKYSTDIQQEVSRFNNEVAKFTTELSEIIQKYRNQNDVLTAEYIAKAQIYVSEYQAEVNSEVSRFASSLQKSGSYLQEAQVRLSKSQDFNQKSQLAIADIESFNKKYEQMIIEFAKG